MDDSNVLLKGQSSRNDRYYFITSSFPLSHHKTHFDSAADQSVMDRTQVRHLERLVSVGSDHFHTHSLQ